ncbi:MAG TPA: F0F1 ATP synthase subunit B [Armatimonadota bacterium]|jgi:F-type H+-transporting ATPase subunit b
MKRFLKNTYRTLSVAAVGLIVCSAGFAEEAAGSEAKPGGLLGSLGLDPRTVIAQALAFIVLLWVLKKVLWGPVLSIIAERQTEVADIYSVAEQAKAAAETARKEYEAHLAAADEESRKRIADALVQANAMKDEILANARQQADRMIASGNESVRQEMEKAQAQIREASTRMAVELAGRIIEQNITVDSQRTLIDRFIEGVGQPQ